ncbi:MAG: hypothetical protein ACLUEQ_02250 [Cloacibacillus evryensis]
MAGIVFFVFLLFLAMSVPIAIAMIVNTLVPLIAERPERAASNAHSEHLQRRGLDTDHRYPALHPRRRPHGGRRHRKLFNVFAALSAKAGRHTDRDVMTCLFYSAISGSGPATGPPSAAMTIPLLSLSAMTNVSVLRWCLLLAVLAS